MGPSFCKLGRQAAAQGNRLPKTVLRKSVFVLLALPLLLSGVSGLSRLGLDEAGYTAEAAPARSKHFDLTYSLWGRELAKYVEKGGAQAGLVHYQRWHNDTAGLDEFVQSLGSLSPSDFKHFSPADREAFWLNAYNALTVQVVLEHYPIKGNDSQYPPDSFRQIRSCWESKKFNIMGVPTTLYDIEHERLRHDFRDPRIHFAVVCASKSCARLSPEPFVGKNLDGRLDQCARDFFADAGNLAVDPSNGYVGVNKIFSWFTLDFAARAGFTSKTFPPPADEEIIASYVSFYVPADERKVLLGYLQNKKLRLEYLNYDWALNDADAAGGKGDGAAGK